MRNRITRSILVLMAMFGVSYAIQAQAPREIPRTPEGKPDFSGYWLDVEMGAPATRTRREIIKELPLTPQGRERAEYLISKDGPNPGETGAVEDPRYHRACGGASSPANLSGPVQIVQDPHRLFLAHIGFPFGEPPKWIRQIWIGRQLPEDPTLYYRHWMGHSVAKWDGNALVVDTIRVKGGTMIDFRMGAPQSDEFTMQERFQRVDPVTLRVERTFNDQTYYPAFPV